MVIDAASPSNSLIKVGETIGRLCFETFAQTQPSPISRQRFRNILKQTELNAPPILASKTPLTLYIMTDEKFIGR